MTDTAVAAPDSALSPAQLAERYGLRVAGLRPGLIDYTRQLWAYRHFIANFANAKLAATFTNARLGRLWQVLTPLTNAAVYFLIFGVILNTKHGIDNFIAYLCTGMFIFNFTSQAAVLGTKAIADNLGLIRALHFPRACLPIAVTLTQLQELAVSVGVLVVIVLITGEPVTAEWLLIPPILLLQAMFNAGLAMTMARLGSKLTDIRQIMPFVTRTWLYASGVFYSVAVFTTHAPQALATILQLNPLLIYINLARHALLESAPLTSPQPREWLLAVGWALLVGIGGYIFFWRGEKDYGRG